MKSNTLNKIIFSAVVMIALLVVDIVFLNFTNKAIVGIGELKKEVLRESDSIKNINETRRKTEELNGIQQQFNEIIIEENQVVNFIAQVENLSAENDLAIDISNVKFVEPTEDSELGEIVMSFNVVGSWSEVTGLISQIEALPYLVNVDSLRLSVSGAGNWSASFNLIGFVR